MRFSASRLSLLPAALLAAVAEADGPKSWTVAVGKGGLKAFDPEIITGANKGDTVTYQFYAQNHSVVQSSFDDPCHPLGGGGGIFSAFVPTSSPDTPSATTFTITINDTNPIWIYCSQTKGSHCQSGMVHSINAPTSGKTHQAYKDKAKNASNSTSPPGGPPGGLPVGGLRKVTVEVGGVDPPLTYTPNNITEPKGTVVQFSFNPANHSVVQSSFDKPCEPLSGGGFSSGFIPTQVRPSGVLFSIEVTDDKPVWFYCAQGKHCQGGMVGSINAPLTGNNTLEAFVAKAKGVPASSIPPNAPLGGVVTVNGTTVSSFNGNVLDFQKLDKGVISHIPKPGENMTGMIGGMAGGQQPMNYNWAPRISDDAAELLRLVLLLDNVLLEVLWAGFDKLRQGGDWAGMYPASIVDHVGGMAAQALVHRQTATDSLQNYNKTMPQPCQVSVPAANLNSWLDAVQELLLLEIGVLTDVITLSATNDSWLVPAMGTQIGAKSRMSAVVNMMQNHRAAAAPREALMPSRLGYSYVMRHFVNGGSCSDALPSDGKVGAQKILPPLQFTDKKRLGGPSSSVTAVTVAIPPDLPANGSDTLYLAWIGAWGGLQFTPVTRSSGSAPVPGNMYGSLWAVMTTKSGVKLQDVPSVAVAGPEPIWVADPSSEQ